MPTLKTKLTKLRDDQDQNYSSSDTWHIALLEYQQTALTFTLNTSTDLITTATAHDFLNGTRVRLASTGVLPTSTPQVLPNTDYVVDSPSGTDLYLLDLTGTPINFSNSGSGILTILDQPPNEFADLAEFIRHETDYDGMSGRPVWDPPSTSTIAPDGRVSKQAIATLDNTAGTLTVAFNIGLLIQNGSSTPGSTAGDWAKYYYWDTLQTVPGGESIPLTLEVFALN